MNQENKPEEKERRFRPAPPDYGEEPPYPESEERGIPTQRRESPYKSIIINAIVALVIVFAMNSFIMPTVGKNTYQVDITRLENDLVAIRNVDVDQNSKITKVVSDAQTIIVNKTNEIDNKINNTSQTLEQRIATAISSFANYATKDSLTNYATSTTVNELSKKIIDQAVEIKSQADSNKELNDKIIALETKNTTLQSQIDTLKDDITITQALSYLTIAGTSNVTNQIPTLAITNLYSMPIDTSSTLVKLTIELPAGITVTSTSQPIISNTGTGGTIVIQTTLGALGISSVVPNTTISVIPSISISSSGTATNSHWLATWSKG